MNNVKKLKTEGGDDVTSTYCDYPEARVLTTPDCVGESSSRSASPEANSLQNLVILRHLFELCPTDVLATCRLVCKKWYEESLLTWRNSSALRFTFGKRHVYLEYAEPGIGDGVWLSLQKFLEYAADPAHQCHEKPYRYIQLKDSTIGSDIAKRKQFELFWNALGRNLTTLELKGCAFSDDEEFCRIIFSRCPNLERLIIDTCKFSATWKGSFEKLDPLECKEQRFEHNKHFKVLKIVGHFVKWKQLPFSWLELFSHFPLMSSFTVTTGDKMSVEDFDSLTKAIRIIRKRDGNLLPFKVFNIGGLTLSTCPLDKQRLIIFQELRLPLRRLLAILEPGVDDDFVRDTFVFYAETLKIVYLAGCIPTPSFFEFLFGHQLDNLLSLNIEKKILSKSFAFLKYMPNLEELEIYEVDCCCECCNPSQRAISNTDEPEPTHLKMMKLTKLTLGCRLEDAVIAKLHDWMPNVTDLRMDLNDKQFEIVCRMWRNLKTFRAIGCKLTDEGVTGKNGANITNLQNLEKFSFESNKLTAKSVFNGFLQLPLLQVLEQFGTKRARWGRMTRRAIQDRNIRLEGNLE